MAKIAIPAKKKIALVCSGGATKAGAFHLGVALALQDQGFKFYGGLGSQVTRQPGPMEISTYVGSSAGSIISSYFAAGFTIEQIFDSFVGKSSSEGSPAPLPRLTYQKMFKLRPGLAREQLKQLLEVRKIAGKLLEGRLDALLNWSWIKATGLFSTAGIESYMREDILPANGFRDLAADLFIVATQLNHSRKVVFGKYSYLPPPHDLTCQYNNDATISDACAASAALPFIFSPHPIINPKGERTFYIDGETRDTLSTHVAVDAGADLVIASYSHQPYHYRPEIGSLTEHGLPAILVQSLFLIIEQKINQFRHSRVTQRSAIVAVERYCKEAHVPAEHTRKILDILETELHHRRDVDTIYIHPDPEDSNFFFGDHFSLSTRKLTEIVKSGFRAGIDTLKQYEFVDHVTGPVVTTTHSGSGPTQT